ncbi:MAG: hypothetical protein ACREFH_11070, partial [Stellaceae bacterium]
MAGVIGALMLAVAATIAWRAEPRWFAEIRPAPHLSLVVLPFANLGNDPTQQYFADGITEDLTTDLSRLADMRVVSRDTAFTYKGVPVNAKRIGRQLNVRYVLEGSVQRSGKEVRINVQLIDAETDTHLWAERFDRSVGDLFALQNEITGRIAAALSLRLTASEAARPTGQPDALDHIFRGRAEIYKPASRRSFAAAIAEFERALALDPYSVEAQSRLASALASRALDEMSGSAKADIERGNRLVEQALAASPDSALAHFAKAQLLRAQHRCDAAIREYELVLAANRNELSSLGNIGRCKIYLGAIDDGVALEQQAIRLSPARDPFLAVWYFRIGQARLLQSRLDDAIAWLEKAHAANPAYPFVATWLAAAYGLKGDLPRAAAELAEGMVAHRYYVLSGTQIVAKGHHFPLLTLVGVVDADLGLTGGDLRAAERTYQLLHQVAGRAGRAERPGRALLQTYLPEQPVMQALAAGDRDGFLAAEATARRAAGLPPFGRLAALIVSAGDPDAADFATRALSRAAPLLPGFSVLGPAPAPLAI